MNFHDPTRTRLANWRPCWLNSYIALPPLQLEPHESDPSLIHLTICHGGRGVWLEKEIPRTDLHKIIHFWETDPEGTFMDLFGLNDWPHEHGHGSVQSKSGSAQSKIVRTHSPIPIEDLI